MTTPVDAWAAAAPEGAPAAPLDLVQASLPVSLIATPRRALRTCRTNDRVGAVLEGNRERYDYIPVVAAEGDRVMGLLQTHDASLDAHRPVAEQMDPLAEGNIIGADTSILEVISSAAEQSARLIVSGARVSSPPHGRRRWRSARTSRRFRIGSSGLVPGVHTSGPHLKSGPSERPLWVRSRPIACGAERPLSLFGG